MRVIRYVWHPQALHLLVREQGHPVGPEIRVAAPSPALREQGRSLGMATDAIAG
jgi:hypothetical protein